MAIQTLKSVNGTSFHGHEFTASVKQIKKIIGTPNYVDNTGRDKVNFEWNCETKTGDVFTIYSWKEYRVIKENEPIDWHIGGHNGSVTSQALEEILELLE